MTFPNFTEKLEVKLEPEPEGAINHGQNHHNNLDSDNLLEHLDDIMGDVINDEDLGIKISLIRNKKFLLDEITRRNS